MMQAALVSAPDAAVMVVSGGLPVGSVKVKVAAVWEAPAEIVKLIGLRVPVTELRVRLTVSVEAWVKGFSDAS